MSEMVERVTDAIIATMFAEHEIPVPDDLRAKYLATARAAIEAMWVPTEAMASAGALRFHEPMFYGDARQIFLGEGSSTVWQRMINAALK